MSGTPRKLARGSALNVINLVATAVVSVLIMPFIVRSLGDRLYGIWALVAAIIGYYGLLELGLSSAIRRYLAAAMGADNREECNRVYNTALFIYTALGAIALLVSIVLAALSPWLTRTPADASLFWKVILIVGVSVAVNFPVRVYRGVLEAHLSFDRAASLDLLALALRTALVIPLLHAGYRVVGLASATLLSNLPSAILSWYFAHREIPYLHIETQYWRRATARTLFSYSTYSFLAQVADILRFQLDSLVVASFLGLAYVTHYSIAGRLSQYFMGLIQALVGVFASVFSRREGAQDFAGMQSAFFFASKISICSASFVAFGLIAWSKPFIARWMGPQYIDSYAPLVALVTGCTFALWQTPSVALLFGISKHKFFAFMSIAEGTLNLILSLILAKYYGMLGVALGTMIPMAITKLLIQPVYVCRVSQIAYREYLAIAGRTLALVVAALIIPLWLTTQLAAPNYRALALLALLSAAAYLPVIWRFVFNAQELVWLNQAIRPRLGLPALAPAETSE